MEERSTLVLMASSGVHNRVERLALEAKRERNRFWRRDEQLDTWQQTLNAQLVARVSRALRVPSKAAGRLLRDG